MNVTPTPTALTLLPDPAVPALPAGHVLATGTFRRLRALAAAGWPLLPVSRLTDIDLAELARIRGRHINATHAVHSVPEQVAWEVADAYDLISSSDPCKVLPDTPAARQAIAVALATATRYAWTATPGDWEGLNIDDPKVTINHGVRHCRYDSGKVRTATAAELLGEIAERYPADRVAETWRRLPTAERHVAILQLYRNRTTSQVAKLIGILPRSVMRCRNTARDHQAAQAAQAAPAERVSA